MFSYFFMFGTAYTLFLLFKKNEAALGKFNNYQEPLPLTTYYYTSKSIFKCLDPVLNTINNADIEVSAITSIWSILLTFVSSVCWLK